MPVTPSTPPWLVSPSNTVLPIKSLQDEITHFVNWISPTPEEKKMRMDALDRLEKVVLKVWNEASVVVFGSYETKLYLPVKK